MFLIGGPAFSGTTLLTLLINQGNLVCLDEPDFHNPEQSHRGIPFLKSLFPEKTFPDRPAKTLSYSDAVRLVEECEKAISPNNLGMKTCDQIFLDYAKIYKENGYPVIAIVRDIRDALVRPLPAWLTENQLNDHYRLVWQNLTMFNLWLRYEELVDDPQKSLLRIARLLGQPLNTTGQWHPEHVHHPMLKLERHDLLLSGRISTSRVGIWRTCQRAFSNNSHDTARLMGY